MTSYMAGARFFVITTKNYTHTHCQHCTPPINVPIPTQAGLHASLCSFCGSLLLMVAIVKKSFCTISLFLIWRIFKEQYSVVLICIIQLVRDWGLGWRASWAVHGSVHGGWCHNLEDFFLQCITTWKMTVGGGHWHLMVTIQPWVF